MLSAGQLRCRWLSGGPALSPREAQGAVPVPAEVACPLAAGPGPSQATPPPPHYLPSVTLRQHRLRRLFPVGFVGSGRGFAAWALAADSVPRSCSLQLGRPSWVALKAVPSWCSLQNELGQKWQNKAEGLPHTSQ